MGKQDLQHGDEHEKKVVRRVLNGDVASFEFLVMRYQGPVYSLACRMMGNMDEAADVAQEAFIRAYEKLDRFDLSKRFFPWLYAITLNVARDQLRKRGRDTAVGVEHLDQLPAHLSGDEQESMQRHIDVGLVYESMQSLPPEYREALILRFKHEFSMKEISESLGLSVSGAKMRVSRGLDMLRTMFEEKFHD